MSAESDALVAAWAGQPAQDLHADITEIIAKVGVGAENPTALADEIAYVVMQHGVPVADIEATR